MNRIIVIGASAGGIQPLIDLLRPLPKGFVAPIFVVVHMNPESTSTLPLILRRSSKLEVVFPRELEEIQSAYVYMAPPNRHMLVETGFVRLGNGARENGFRPAIDPLFRTAALAYEEHVTGILLSGSLDDGTAGLATIKSKGGIAVVQDPDEAEFPSMPRSAIAHVEIDHIKPISEITQLLLQIAQSPINEKPQGEKAMNAPTDPDTKQGPGMHMSCPDCGGVLTPQDDGNFVHFECEVGHIYSPKTLLSEKNKEIENYLWSVTRTLQEKSRLTAHVFSALQQKGQQVDPEELAQRLQEIQSQWETIHNMITRFNAADEGFRSF